MATPPEPLRKPLDNDTLWLLRKIWDRVNERNEHFVGCIVGPEGWGKSSTALKISDILDPSFTHDRVIFDVADLLRILRDRDHEQGQFFVLDEAGVQLGNRTWQERSQILVNQALQIFRDHNLGLLFTLPRLGELDSQAQGRLQAFMEITEKHEGDHIRGKFKLMDPDRTDETGKIYKKFPRRRLGTGGQVHRIRSIAFTPPRQDLFDKYKAQKEEFQEQFYEKALDSLAGETDEEDESTGATGAKEVYEDIMSNGGPETYLRTANNGREYIDADLIEVDHGLSAREAKKVKKLLVREHGGGEG